MKNYFVTNSENVVVFASKIKSIAQLFIDMYEDPKCSGPLYLNERNEQLPETVYEWVGDTQQNLSEAASYLMAYVSEMIFDIELTTPKYYYDIMNADTGEIEFGTHSEQLANEYIARHSENKYEVFKSRK